MNTTMTCPLKNTTVLQKALNASFKTDKQAASGIEGRKKPSADMQHCCSMWHIYFKCDDLAL